MIFNIIIEKRAKLEVEKTYLYYKSISGKLGKKFIDEYQDKLNVLQTFPFFQRRYLKIHVLPLKKFPYSIHFLIDDKNNLVTIQALICDHQNPEKTYIK
ncbi:MAG: hypothetical protein H7195_05615 [Chryseobacterium sp.]|nr:hypothetical protein [Chryseobacterium sp.]